MNDIVRTGDVRRELFEKAVTWEDEGYFSSEQEMATIMIVLDIEEVYARFEKTTRKHILGYAETDSGGANAALTVIVFDEIQKPKNIYNLIEFDVNSIQSWQTLDNMIKYSGAGKEAEDRFSYD